MGINKALTEELEEIEAALQRMKDGTYGVCIASKQNIPYERLEAIPYTAYAVEYSPGRELSSDRPVEEQVMSLPPAGTGEDGRSIAEDLMMPGPGIPLRTTAAPALRSHLPGRM